MAAGGAGAPPSKQLQAFVLTLLVLQNSAASLLMRWCQLSTEGARAPFSNAAALLCGEVFKFCVSLALCMSVEGKSLASIATLLQQWMSRWTSLWKLAVPGVLYALSNNLGFAASLHLDAPTLQVLFQLKIVVAALVQVVLLGRSPSPLQWGALTGLVIGVGTVQVSALGGGSDLPSPPGSLLTGVAFSLAAVCLGALAGGWTEWQLRADRSRSVWTFNIQLAVVSMFLNAGLCVASPVDRAIVTSPGGLLTGFTSQVWLLVLLSASGGLLAALSVKVTSSVTKGVATSVSIALSTGASSFLFGTPVSPPALLGILIVGASSALYAGGGPGGVFHSLWYPRPKDSPPSSPRPLRRVHSRTALRKRVTGATSPNKAAAEHTMAGSSGKSDQTV